MFGDVWRVSSMTLLMWPAAADDSTYPSANVADFAARGLAGEPLGLLETLDEGERAFLKLLAGERQLDFFLRAAREKRHAKMRFKPFDLLAERRGCDVQTFGRAREMQFRRDGREVPEVPNFHRKIMRLDLAKSQPCVGFTARECKFCVNLVEPLPARGMPGRSRAMISH